jgi:hypothetical protein
MFSFLFPLSSLPDAPRVPSLSSRVYSSRHRIAIIGRSLLHAVVVNMSIWNDGESSEEWLGLSARFLCPLVVCIVKLGFLVIWEFLFHVELSYLFSNLLLIRILPLDYALNTTNNPTFHGIAVDS